MRPVAAAFLPALLMVAPAVAQDDGPASGPDFWAVAGLRVESALNVRTGPSTRSPVVVQVSEGTILRNLGCQGEARQRWCKVESPDGLAISGWVSGLFLRESGPPPAGDALVAGTPYNATGYLPCTLASSDDTTLCPYGVIRANAALASIFITLPDGSERLLEFRDGLPVAPPATTMTSSKRDDMTTVTLDGGTETYTIADVVFLGD